MGSETRQSGGNAPLPFSFHQQQSCKPSEDDVGGVGLIQVWRIVMQPKTKLGSSLRWNDEVVLEQAEGPSSRSVSGGISRRPS